uniref:patatin-like phospholipase domain-containing protein 4 isoform X1 n=1 Tax=Urocitellus parryii TaxID=9999 RepID=UPI000E55C615|nr:patatin-like phospholipase domain-containing protein 4 isoform X1 [Urocitellus parryii]XP_026266937.1 patatin-like phospholipase domain-containing protein 4 isoform X1 [Urocitellus parryii]XP_026266938.1 patatin-like phospholipase domain-containing protein 4 isoform X1 [Urocitellus parryii]XP_026266940.1 patatin-like phospholipase domain-containing protein 4 isoform X1 [Urocitellus parryii]
MKPINLSFAACGFLGIYHLGAASAFCRHGQRLLKDVQAFAGASAGSLVASVLLTAPEKIEECNRFTYQFAEETRKQSFGAATPGYDFMARLRSGVDSILPPHAHELAQDRLYVSITNTRTRQNYLVSRFPSREDLIKVLLASSFVPIYAGLRPVEYQGQVKSPSRRSSRQSPQKSTSSKRGRFPYSGPDPRVRILCINSFVSKKKNWMLFDPLSKCGSSLPVRDTGSTPASHPPAPTLSDTQQRQAFYNQAPFLLHPHQPARWV